MKRITFAQLLALRNSEEEHALFDVRESAQAHRGHIFGATFLPRRLLAQRIGALVGRRGTSIVVYDDGGADCRAQYAAQALARLGYEAVSVLQGGLDASLAAGQRLCRGSNVPSKWFGETVQEHAGVPTVSVDVLHQWQQAAKPLRVCDIRSPEEYARARVPQAVGAFGADLAGLAADLRRAGQPVVVHCSGRTRSIIACQALRLLGVDEVYALENGTMGWRLAGLPLERGPGPGVLLPSVDSRLDGRSRAMALAHAAGAERLEPGALQALLERRDAGTLNLYVLDVRQVAEFAATHVPGSLALPGGLAVQRTDEFIAVRAAAIVLVDDDETRASLTAYWLRAMGLPRVAVLAGGLPAWQAQGLPTRAGRDRPGSRDDAIAQREIATASAAEVREALAADRLWFVDTQSRYLACRPAGSLWVPFGDLESRLESLGEAASERPPVLVAEREALARTAALNARFAGWDGLKVMVDWQGAEADLATGPTDAVPDVSDVVVQPYDAGLEAMREYLRWEQTLTQDCREQRFFTPYARLGMGQEHSNFQETH